MMEGKPTNEDITLKQIEDQKLFVRRYVAF